MSPLDKLLEQQTRSRTAKRMADKAWPHIVRALEAALGGEADIVAVENTSMPDDYGDDCHEITITFPCQGTWNSQAHLSLFLTGWEMEPSPKAIERLQHEAGREC